MDGTLARILVHFALPAGIVGVVGCSSVDPEPEHVPYSLYDSPVVAGDFSDSDPDRTDEARSAGSETPAGSKSANATTDAPESNTTESSTDARAAGATSESGSSDAAPTPDAPGGGEAANADSNSDSAEGPASTRANRDAARYVAAMYELNGVSLPEKTRSDIPALYRHCRESDSTFQSREPATGDLVFFHNVRDANDDGRNNDWYTYVGMVESVDSSGTVTVLGYRDGSVRTFRMNLSRPDVETSDGGRTLNTELREERNDDPPYTRYLAGELFAGYCSLLGNTSELLVVDNWQPGMDLEVPEEEK